MDGQTAGSNVKQQRAHKFGSPADQQEKPFKNVIIRVSESLTFA